MASDVTPIPYAGVLTRCGVTEMHRDGTTTITLPRRRLPINANVVYTVGSIVGGLIWTLAGVWSSWPTARGAVGSIVWMLLVIAAAGFFLSMLGRPVIIHITATNVRIENLAIRDDTGSRPVIVLPRTDVYRAYYRSFAKAVFIRTHGKEMVEIPLNYPDLAGEAAAELLRRNLGLVESGEDVAAS